MKRTLRLLMITSLLALPLSLQSQQPAPPSSPPPAQPAPNPTPAPSPTPAPAPAPTSASPSPSPAAPQEIPVISIGDQVKPMNDGKEVKTDATSTDPTTAKKAPRKTVKTPKTPRVDINVPVVLEARQLVHSRLSQVGDEVVFVVAENYPPKGQYPLLPKGSMVVGKITAIERIQKDQPGGIRVSLDAAISPTGAAISLPGVLEVIRQKGQDNIGGTEVFIPVGLRQNANLSKRLTTRVAAKSTRIKAPKGQLNAPAEIRVGEVTVKLKDLKYPTRIDILVEGPPGMEVTDLNEDSIRIVRINDFTLPRAISPLEEKIKVADRNKNNVKDISYRFPGWDIVRYLPEGSSTVILNAQTKDGKPVELIATIRNVYK